MFDLEHLSQDERHAACACIYEILFQRSKGPIYTAFFNKKFGNMADRGMVQLQSRINEQYSLDH